MFFFFFFKQKTAYEILTCDWSSDVCSSDLALGLSGGGVAALYAVGSDLKSIGCTGIPTPTGDFYAVDYVAHEMGQIGRASCRERV
mgnify:CR=1 FL=1